MSELLSLCSLSQGGQVCRDWIFHGIVTDCFKVLDRSELEGKELCNTTFLQESKDIILLFKKKNLEHCFLGLLSQGEFYNIGKHQEPPFSPAAFNLPPQNNNMLYIGMSAFTVNSAAFVYNNAGVLSLSITDDMVNCCLLSLIPSFQDIKLI